MHTINNEILTALRQHKAQLFKKYPLQSMAVFGVSGRGEETNKSDVKILVEINGVTGFKFLHLNYEIEYLLKKACIQQIEPELIYV